MQTIKYYRDSVCAADDYINRPQTIEMADEATLEDLVQFITSTHDGNYSYIPYTGGQAFWALEADAGRLAVVCDDGKQVTYSDYAPKTLLSEIGVTSIKGKHLPYET